MHRASMLALITALAVGAEARAQGRPRAGDLAVEVALGRSLTFVRNPIGRTVSDIADPWTVRLAGGVSLGGGVWLEGVMRATPTESFEQVRWFTFGAGMRLDTSDGAVLSTSLRMGWSGTVTAGLQHGAHAAFAVNIRPVRAFTLFLETGVEAFPGMSFERTTVNQRVREQSLVVGTLWYGGGVRFTL
ncbi:MAG: hypothetical protein U0325_08540 [Polyangiales bacterium]